MTSSACQERRVGMPDFPKVPKVGLPSFPKVGRSSQGPQQQQQRQQQGAPAPPPPDQQPPPKKDVPADKEKPEQSEKVPAKNTAVNPAVNTIHAILETGSTAAQANLLLELTEHLAEGKIVSSVVSDVCRVRLPRQLSKAVCVNTAAEDAFPARLDATHRCE